MLPELKQKIEALKQERSYLEVNITSAITFVLNHNAH